MAASRNLGKLSVACGELIQGALDARVNGGADFDPLGVEAAEGAGLVEALEALDVPALLADAGVTQ